MRKLLFAITVVICTTLSASAEQRLEDMNWSQRGANPAKTGAVPWSMGPHFKPDTSPVSIPDIIEGVSTWGDSFFVATQKNKLICMSKGRELLWSATLPGKPVGAPAIGGKSAYVQTMEGVLLKFDAIKGTKLTETKMNPGGSTDVTISGRYAVFGGGNQVVCFDTRASVRKWLFKTSKPAQPAAISGSLVFINHQNMLSCVKLFDGKVLWDLKTPDSKLFVGTPTVGSGMVFMPTLDGKIHAYSMFTGRLAWESPTVSVKPVTFDKGRLYIPTNSRIVCLDATDGGRIWASEKIEQPIWSQIAKLENCLIVASKDKKLVVLNPQNGRQMSVIPITKQVVVDFAVGNCYLVIPDNTYKIDKGNKICIVLPQ